MGVLGAVSVVATTLVKVVSAVGIVAGGWTLGVAALGFIVTGQIQEPFITDAISGAIPLIAGLTGWEMANWVNGNAQRIDSKSAHDAEMARLRNSVCGQAL